VRHAATDIAVAAATELAAQSSKGAKGAELISQSIKAVKEQLH
jgi:hypothetical protein